MYIIRNNPQYIVQWKKVQKKWKKVLTKGVIECIIIKSSVERAKEHGEEKCSGWEEVKNFFKKTFKKVLTNWKQCDRINKLSQESMYIER